MQYIHEAESEELTERPQEPSQKVPEKPMYLPPERLMMTIDSTEHSPIKLVEE